MICCNSYVIGLRRMQQDLTPCGPTPSVPYSPCKPASPYWSYKDLFSLSDRTYKNDWSPERKKKNKGRATWSQFKKWKTETKDFESTHRTQGIISVY